MDANALDDLVAIERGGSLSAAARQRRVAVSTIARRIAALETHLSLSLLDRRADRVQLTPNGKRIAQLAEPLADRLDEIVRTARSLSEGGSDTPIRISATEFVISDVLAPRVAQFWHANPGFALQLTSQANVVSLSGREADLAIRMSPPVGDSLMQRRLSPIALGFYARAGHDWSVGEAPLLAYDDSYGEIPERRWLSAHGWSSRLALATGSTRALLVAARTGAGIALLPEAIAAREPALQRLPLPAPPPRTPALVFHRDLKRRRDIKLVREWIVRCFEELTRVPE